MKNMDFQLSKAMSDVSKACSDFILFFLEVGRWISVILWFLKFEKPWFWSLLDDICFEKSLKNLSDYLNIFGSHKARSQLSLAIFTASRTYVVAQKSWKQFQTPSKLVNPYVAMSGFSPLRDILWISSYWMISKRID